MDATPGGSTPDAERRERRARKALVVALVCLLGAPLLVGILAGVTIYGFRAFDWLPVEALFGVLLAMGALVGLPGIVTGWRALEGTSQVQRARRAAVAAILLGVLTGV